MCNQNIPDGDVSYIMYPRYTCAHLFFGGGLAQTCEALQRNLEALVARRRKDTAEKTCKKKKTENVLAFKIKWYVCV